MIPLFHVLPNSSFEATVITAIQKALPNTLPLTFSLAATQTQQMNYTTDE